MKRILLLAALAVAAAPSLAADVGVSVSVGQPGFYGHIDIGNFPQPQLIYPQPVIVQPVPVGVAPPQPIYLHVPPGHAKNWRKHCRKYNACGQPVYFVHDNWYNNVYVPHYAEHRGEQRGEHDHDHGEGRGREGGREHGHGHRGD